MPRIATIVLAAIALSAGLPAAGWAGAPEPLKTLDLDRFMGRWYEIMRTPNIHEMNCFAAFQDWTRAPSGQFAIQQHCRGGSAAGAERLVNTAAKVLNAPANTKFEATFFAGLIHGRYWVIDHADDYQWMIATTEDGRFPALLARTPSLPESEVSRLKAHMEELGLPIRRLQQVGE
jgi:apolipoprotein D and lipocalin family protein